MICLPTHLHVTGLGVAGEILFINSFTDLAVLALRPGVGAGADLHHHPSATGGVARRVHGGPGADKYKERINGESKDCQTWLNIIPLSKLTNFKTTLF